MGQRLDKARGIRVRVGGDMRKQKRRENALIRFHIDRERAATDKGYAKQKEMELASLKASLHIQ